MNEYETKWAVTLANQFGQDWFMHGATDQQMRDYVRATSTVARDKVIMGMKMAAIRYANGCAHAAIHAGFIPGFAVVSTNPD